VPSGLGSAPRPLRRNAERDRRRILDAARAQVSEKGLALRYDEVARAADVAVGTVYNSSPDRADLIDALFPDRSGRSCGSPNLLLRSKTLGRHWSVLCPISRPCRSRTAGLYELLYGARAGVPLAAIARARISPIAGCCSNGRKPPGQSAPTSITPISPWCRRWSAQSLSAPAYPDLWLRPLAIVLDGFHVGAPKVLPTHAGCGRRMRDPVCLAERTLGDVSRTERTIADSTVTKCTSPTGALGSTGSTAMFMATVSPYSGQPCCESGLTMSSPPPG